MSRFDNPLNRVTIAAPCPADWNKMHGNERIRFCEQCSLNVYNLSAMSQSEAETLIMRTEGRLCVRYYRRADGTILTNNCPVGLQALKRRVTRIARGVLTTIIGFFAGVSALAGWQKVENWFDQRSQVVLGDIVRTTVVLGGMVREPAIEIPSPDLIAIAGEMTFIDEQPLKIKKQKRSRPRNKAASAKNLRRVVDRD